MESEYEGTCDQTELKTLLNELEVSYKMQEKEAKYHVIKLQEESLKVKQILSKISLVVRSAEQKGNIEDYQALYKKAIEERDEYKLKAHNQACAIMKLERELCKIKNGTLDNKNVGSNSASYLDKEIDFLHTENASLRNELRCLKNLLNDQEHLKKELSDSKLENISLKEQIVNKQTELMEMQYQFDSKLKKVQTECEQHTLNLQKKLSECQEQLTEAKISKELTESNLKEKYACALNKVKEMQQKLEKIVDDNGNEGTCIVGSPPDKSENSAKMANEFAESNGCEQTKITTVITTTRSSSSTVTTTEKVLKTSYSSEDSPERNGSDKSNKIKLKKGVAVCLLDDEEQLVVKGEERSDDCENEDLSEEEVDEICILL
ncbi:uncharacterized protein LOC126462641 [Schistocerca serialis cubense]|uniref:uncharacterized protein LOC126462641 n=1 Tax=Schistocerca serialis cubense TaxID=2023355 RepID=UPI00214EB60D|nr:uncharacterized protein LOC126462641 [Schistocerca serialis cubense]XP_049952046.1 uncharacterized protein LOC126462641 [Schistocerca serialis cubense]XP_049952047.1 uncharacterized protein LOC126462641 [Schistocerca serialis cubense]